MLKAEFQLLLDKLVKKLGNLNYNISREYLGIILYRLDGVMYHRSIDNLLVRALIAGVPYTKEIWDVPLSVVNNPEIVTKYDELLRYIIKVCDEIKDEKTDFTATAIYRNCVISHTPHLW